MVLQIYLGFRVNNLTDLTNSKFVLIIKKAEIALYTSNQSIVQQGSVQFLPNYNLQVEFYQDNKIDIEICRIAPNANQQLEVVFRSLNLTNLAQIVNVKSFRAKHERTGKAVELKIDLEKRAGNVNNLIKFDMEVMNMKYDKLELSIKRPVEQSDLPHTLVYHQCFTTENRITYNDFQTALCGGSILVPLTFVLTKKQNKGRKQKELLKFEVRLDKLLHDEIKETFEYKTGFGMKTKKKGELIIHRATNNQKTPVEIYINEGLEIQCAIGIDFTVSNLPRCSPESLHYFSASSPSPYEIALRNLITILDQYDADNMYPVYGFGAFPNENSNEVSFCFPLHEGNTLCKSIDGVLEAYKNTLKDVVMSGPTYMSNLIKTFKNNIRTSIQNARNDLYFILVILTDGDVDDVEKTKNEIMEATNLPLSIVIIGIGNDKESKFKTLIDIDNKLELNGVKAQRDIVKFVEFRNYLQETRDHPRQVNTEFSKAVLEEIPQQIHEYFSLIKKRYI